MIPPKEMMRHCEAQVRSIKDNNINLWSATRIVKEIVRPHVSRCELEGALVMRQVISRTTLTPALSRSGPSPRPSPVPGEGDWSGLGGVVGVDREVVDRSSVGGSW